MLKVLSTSARAVWNGPFHIGKLTRPVTLGEVAMKVLETCWRGAVIVAILAAVTIATVAVQQAVPEKASPRTQTLADQITATVTTGSSDCDATYPLSIAIKNNSGERVGNVRFRVFAYLPYRTTELTDFSTNEYVSDVIIPAGRTLTTCWKAPRLIEPHDVKELTFRVEVEDAMVTNLPEPPIGPWTKYQGG